MNKKELQKEIEKIVTYDNDGREPYKDTMPRIMSLISDYEEGIVRKVVGLCNAYLKDRAINTAEFCHQLENLTKQIK